jgi:hypothetical protein
MQTESAAGSRQQIHRQQQHACGRVGGWAGGWVGERVTERQQLPACAVPLHCWRGAQGACPDIQQMGACGDT